MDFQSHSMSEIKGKVSGLSGYADIAKQSFTGDINQCLSETIHIFESKSDNIYRYVLTSQGEQIADCKIIVDNDTQQYHVSSIAVVPNLQKKGIGRNFYDEYVIPSFEKTHPGYVFVPGPKQTNLGEKLRKGR